MSYRVMETARFLFAGYLFFTFLELLIRFFKQVEIDISVTYKPDNGEGESPDECPCKGKEI